jgi:hypothetical protein
MIKIEEHMLLSKQERQHHLKLDEACIEKGGCSIDFRGLLAYILDTTIPWKNGIQLCHACHNGKCSNPYHLYWGTNAENNQDAIANGKKSIWQCTVEKYGEEAARRMNKQNGIKQAIVKAEQARVKTEAAKLERLASGDARQIRERNSQYGSHWVKKQNKEIKVGGDELVVFIAHGWELGRIKRPPKPLARLSLVGKTCDSDSQEIGSNPVAAAI